MSKIFRNVPMNEFSEKTRSIQIKNLQFTEKIDEDRPLTLEMLMKERDQLIFEAEQHILSKKAELANDIEQNKQYIETELRTWEEQKLAFQQAAYDEGFNQGLEEGRNKAQADMSDALNTANETIQIAHKNATDYLQHQEQVILELAIRSAERIIGAKLEDDEQLFLSIVRRGLKEAREMKEIKLYVSSNYFTLVSSNREELASIFPVDVPFMIFVDEDMAATDCYIETNHGRIVASIDEQLHELRQKLVEILDSLE